MIAQTDIATSASAVNSVVTASFTPGASSLLVVSVEAEWDGTAGVGTIADTLGGLTWTNITNFNDSNFGKFAAWYALAPASPSAGTVTVAFNATAGTRRFAVVVDEVTGADTSTPVTQSVVNTSAFATTVPLAFSVAPAASSLVYTVMLQQSATAATAPTGFTALTSQLNGGSTGRVVTAYKASAAAQSNSWTGAPANQTDAFALEVKAAAGPAAEPGRRPASPGKTWKRRFKHRQLQLPDTSIVADPPPTSVWLPGLATPRRVVRRVPTMRANSGTDVPDGSQLLPGSLKRGASRVRRRSPLPPVGRSAFGPPDVVNPALPSTRRRVRRLPRLFVGGDVFEPPFVVAAGGGTGTIGAAKVGTMAENASATALAGNLPGTLVVGDFMVCTWATSATPANSSISAGWTAMPITGFTAGEIAFNTETLGVFYRFSDGTASDTPTVSQSALGRVSVSVIAYTGVDPVTPIDVTGQSNVAPAGPSAVVPSITPVTTNARIFGGAAMDAAASADITKPAQMTDLSHAVGTGRREVVASDTVDGTSGLPTGTRTWTEVTITNLAVAAFTVAFRPAAGAAAPVFVWVASRVRARLPRLTRSRVAVVVPAQETVVTNPPITWVSGRSRRLPVLRRRVPFGTGLPEEQMAPVSPAARRKGVLPVRRGLVGKPIPGQVNPPIQPNPDVRGRVGVRLFKRGRVVNPVPAQQAPATNPAITQSTSVRGRLAARALRWPRIENPTPAQQAAPTNPSITQTTGVRGKLLRLRPTRRGAAPSAAGRGQAVPVPPVTAQLSPRAVRRGRAVTPVPVQQQATPNPPVTQTAGVRGRLLSLRAVRRGRAANPTPAQQQAIPNPSITQVVGVRGRLLALRAVRRGSAVTPTRTQVNPPYPVKPSRVVSVKGMKPRGRTGVTVPVPGQDAKAAVGPRRPRLLRAIAFVIPRRFGRIFEKITTLSGPVQVTDSHGTVYSTEASGSTVAGSVSSASVADGGVGSTSSSTVSDADTSRGTVTSSEGSTDQVQP